MSTHHNDTLDYPREILLEIFAKSNWNLVTRALNKGFLHIYNQYSQFYIIILKEKDLDVIRKDLCNMNLKIEVSNFIPDNLDKITDLYLGYENIAADDVKTLVSALETNKTLITLNLRGNDIRDEGALALSSALRINKTLTTLGLRYTNIEDNGALALASVLEINKTLTTLDLSDNDIGTIGTQALAPYKNRVTHSSEYMIEYL